MIFSGSRSAPLVLGATGGATDVATFTHTHNAARTYLVTVYDSNTGERLPTASVAVTQTGNAVTLTNTTAGALNVIVQLVDPHAFGTYGTSIFPIGDWNFS